MMEHMVVSAVISGSITWRQILQIFWGQASICGKRNIMLFIIPIQIFMAWMMISKPVHYYAFVMNSPVIRYIGTSIFIFGPPIPYCISFGFLSQITENIFLVKLVP